MLQEATLPIDPLLVRDNDTLEAALGRLDRGGLGLAFVVDGKGALTGRLCARDIAACLDRGGTLSLDVRAAMTPDSGAAARECRVVRNRWQPAAQRLRCSQQPEAISSSSIM